MLCRCGFHVEKERYRKGHVLCLHCGDKQARAEILIKQAQTGPLYNKGPIQFMGGDSFKQNALDSGKKTSNYSEPVIGTGRVKTIKPSKPKRKVIGFYVRGGDRYCLYEGEDPKKMGASKWAIY